MGDSVILPAMVLDPNLYNIDTYLSLLSFRASELLRPAIISRAGIVSP